MAVILKKNKTDIQRSQMEFLYCMRFVEKGNLLFLISLRISLSLASRMQMVCRKKIVNNCGMRLFYFRRNEVKLILKEKIIFSCCLQLNVIGIHEYERVIFFLALIIDRHMPYLWYFSCNFRFVFYGLLCSEQPHTNSATR